MYHCPIHDYTCPYCTGPDAVCELENPAADCDDYYAAVGDEEEDESGD